jgi:hypothetical protein
MCVVSMIMDHYGDKWRDRLPGQWPYQEYPTQPWQFPQPFRPPTETAEEHAERLREFFERHAQTQQPAPAVTPTITAEEIAEFRQLLERAREYDKRNSEPECELEEKKAAVRQIAKQLGVEINFL